MVTNVEDGFLELGGRLNNKTHGRGILIHSDGTIYIGYFKDGDDAVGNFICILSTGTIDVEDYYRNRNGATDAIYTLYKTDGSTGKCGDQSSQVESVCQNFQTLDFEGVAEDTDEEELFDCEDLIPAESKINAIPIVPSFTSNKLIQNNNVQIQKPD